MLILVVQFFLGLLYANAGEWLVHKHILHALGKNRHSFWAYHLHEHHAVCISNNMLDPGYQKLTLTTWNTQSKELVVLAGFVLLHVPILLIFPLFTSAVYASLALIITSIVRPIWIRSGPGGTCVGIMNTTLVETQVQIGVSLGHGTIT